MPYWCGCAKVANWQLWAQIYPSRRSLGIYGGKNIQKKSPTTLPIDKIMQWIMSPLESQSQSMQHISLKESAHQPPALHAFLVTAASMQASSSSSMPKVQEFCWLFKVPHIKKTLRMHQGHCYTSIALCQAGLL